MRIKKGTYEYPDSLVALKPEEPCRVLFMEEKKDFSPTEIKITDVFDLFEKGDVLVVNNSGVKACRIFHNKREVLFLKESLEDGENIWSVLFKSSKMKIGDKFDLPGGLHAEFIKKGRPQKVKVSEKINTEYFNKYGEMALPPYIQKLREQRQNIKEDGGWYQLDWKKNQNSLAAPTASLHFKQSDLDSLRAKGVDVVEVSLDVGLGTFLPLDEENFDQGKLHEETYFVSKETKEVLFEAKKNKQRIWALGTTALRALESMSDDLAEESSSTELFIQPGYSFKWVSGLLTNFHQPNSSLIYLVMAFFGEEEVLKAYKHAVKNNFRLFSYGDLSVWTRPKP